MGAARNKMVKSEGDLERWKARQQDKWRIRLTLGEKIEAKAMLMAFRPTDASLVPFLIHALACLMAGGDLEIPQDAEAQAALLARIQEPTWLELTVMDAATILHVFGAKVGLGEVDGAMAYRLQYFLGRLEAVRDGSYAEGEVEALAASALPSSEPAPPSTEVH